MRMTLRPGSGGVGRGDVCSGQTVSKYVALCEMSSYSTTHTHTHTHFTLQHSGLMINVNLSVMYCLHTNMPRRDSRGAIKDQSLHHFTLLLSQLRSIIILMLRFPAYMDFSFRFVFMSVECV